MKNDSIQKIQGTVVKVLAHLRDGQKRVALDLAHGGRQPQQWDMLVQRLAQKASQHKGFAISKDEAKVLCSQHGFILDSAMEGALQTALTALGVTLTDDANGYVRPDYGVKDREFIRKSSKFVALAGKNW